MSGQHLSAPPGSKACAEVKHKLSFGDMRLSLTRGRVKKKTIGTKARKNKKKEKKITFDMPPYYP